MPVIVRNAWVDMQVSGRRDIGTGPKGKDGTLNAQFYVREEGGVARSVRVATFVYGDELHLTVFGPEGNEIFNHITSR